MSVLSYMRQRRGLSQRDLAEQLGVTTHRVAAFECGVAKVDDASAMTLSSIFDVPADIFASNDSEVAFGVHGVPAGFYSEPIPSGDVPCGEYVFSVEDAAGDLSCPLFSLHIAEDGRFVQLASELVRDDSVFGKRVCVAFAARGYIDSSGCRFVYEQYADLTSIMPERSDLFGIAPYLNWRDWPQRDIELYTLAPARLMDADESDISVAAIDSSPDVYFLRAGSSGCMAILAKALFDDKLETIELTLRGHAVVQPGVRREFLSNHPGACDRTLAISQRGGSVLL